MQRNLTPPLLYYRPDFRKLFAHLSHLLAVAIPVKAIGQFVVSNTKVQ